MKIFIDCGYYVGKALEYYAPLMDETWKVYAFEPYENLPTNENRFPFEVELIRKAVWTHDGKTRFRIGGRNDSSHISDLHPESSGTEDIVDCINFSRFVKELPDTTIVVSMDIEGAEFPVLEKMLKDGTAKKITLLDIEFHHRVLKDKTPEDASLLRRSLEGEGILVKTKVDI